jgi:hypothetical protein
MNYEPVYILCFCMFNAINIQVYSTVLSRIIESMLNEKDVGEQQSWRTTLISVSVFLLVFFSKFLYWLILISSYSSSSAPILQRASWPLLQHHLCVFWPAVWSTTSSPFWSCHAVGSHVECLLKAISYVCKLRDNDVLCIDVIIKLLVTTKLPVCGCECLCCTVFCGEEIKLNGTHVRYWFRLKLKIIFKNKSLILCTMQPSDGCWKM